MSRQKKLLLTILHGHSDENISFSSLRMLMKTLGFDERIKGDHFIFSMNGVEEIINLQPNMDKAKAYQVRQVRNIIVKYRLNIGD